MHGERPEAPAAGSDPPGIDRVDALRAFDVDRAALDATVAAITHLQQAWPEHEISDRVRAATTQLQTSAPQSPHFNLYGLSLWPPSQPDRPGQPPPTQAAEGVAPADAVHAPPPRCGGGVLRGVENANEGGVHDADEL
ncbi:hypothetical protein [Streptomyces sp. NPDC051001]|uniref:hypothetical protein n=1 Tax=Streptomyces sp. NPDC051001 TaxID=3155795 RepID=UPI00341FAD3C